MANMKDQTPGKGAGDSSTTQKQAFEKTSSNKTGLENKTGIAGNVGSGRSAELSSISGGSSSFGPAGGNAAGTSGAGTAVARSFYDQAKDTAGQAYEVAAEKATTKLEEQKTNLSGGLSSIADSVRKVGENLRGPDVQDGITKFTSDYSGKAAEKIEGVANYFERKNVREMYSDLEGFARRNPMAFIGGAFALGLLTARFLKSGSSQASDTFNRSTPQDRDLKTVSGAGVADTRTKLEV